MSILIDKETQVICQGITGKAGGFHTTMCREYGTQIVAGVTPGKSGQLFDKDIPVYDTVDFTMRNHHVDATMIFVPPLLAGDAIEEAAEAGIRLIVCITEGIPQKDMIKARATVMKYRATLIGPNCPGIISPGKSKIGIMPGYIHKPGEIGVISRSGTLTYEAVWQLTTLGLGQSTCVGMGGDPIHGVGFIDLLELFEKDDQTKGIVLIGEIGGSDEEKAAEWIGKNGTKPIVAFIAGKSAPPGRRMGHAGAIISGSSGTATDKINALKNAGVTIVDDPTEMGKTMLSVLSNKAVV